MDALAKTAKKEGRGVGKILERVKWYERCVKAIKEQLVIHRRGHQLEREGYINQIRALERNIASMQRHGAAGQAAGVRFSPQTPPHPGFSTPGNVHRLH